ncbi:MAG TPA: MFS transporter, partial [Pseudonocardia sp.]|nr:MFS transporter [Pseudonocardia sp.]
MTQPRWTREEAGLLSASLLSGLGNGITTLALPWLVVERTSSAAAAGIVAASNAAPMLVLAVFSGLLVDRFGSRRISVLSDTASAASVLSIAVVTASTSAVWPVAVLAAAGAALDQAGVTARTALIPVVCAARGRPTARLNGAYSATSVAGATCGPAVAGVLIASTGVQGALAAAATLSAGAALSILLVRRAAASPALPGTAGTSGFRAVFLGAGVIAADPLLRFLAVQSFLLFLLFL